MFTLMMVLLVSLVLVWAEDRKIEIENMGCLFFFSMVADLVLLYMVGLWQGWW